MLAEEVEKNALKLDRDKRIHLIESLYDSLDQTDPEIEQAWVAESEKRYRSYKQGDIEGVDLDQVRDVAASDLPPLFYKEICA